MLRSSVRPRADGSRPSSALLCAVSIAGHVGAAGKPRARDLGVPFTGTPGPLNAITDVAGVEVGHTTLISGEGALVRGKGPVRTGVTADSPEGPRFSRPGVRRAGTH